MQILPLTPERREAWDAFCANSPDAWFWHATDWIDYNAAYRPERRPKPLCFMMTEGGRVQAVVPLFLEQHSEYGRDWKWLAMGGNPAPAPALSGDLTPVQRANLLDHIFAVIEGMAQELNVDYSCFGVSTLCPAVVRPVRAPHNFLLRHHYLDASFSTQILDLKLPEERLWADLHRRHRQSILEAREKMTVRVHSAPQLTPEIFDRYRLMHARAAGRVTRPRETFDLMSRWACAGRGFLAEAVLHDGTSVGFESFMSHKSAAFALSACNEPGHEDLPVRHLIEWESILWMKSRGIEFYEVGAQPFATLPYFFPDRKLLDIGHFTYRFGGFTSPMIRAERFHSRELWDIVSRDRTGRFAEGYAWKPAVAGEEGRDLLRRIASPAVPAAEAEAAPEASPELIRLAEAVVSENPGRVSDYLSGSERVLNALLGQVLSRAGGSCAPRAAQAALLQVLARARERRS